MPPLRLAVFLFLLSYAIGFVVASLQPVPAGIAECTTDTDCAIRYGIAPF